MKIIHHGAVNGVTGSCHQLFINETDSILIDCGLFQGDEAAHKIACGIDFEVTGIAALIVTHTHIDHVGRIPYLLAAGFDGPIYATVASAELLPLIIEDALRVGVTRDRKLIEAVLSTLRRRIKPIPYKQWFEVAGVNSQSTIKAKFQPAGHILGSAFVEIDLNSDNKRNGQPHRVVFSGDLGAPYTPLLPSPKPPYKADTLVIESTYGDHLHHGRKARRKQLQKTIERAVVDNGVVLIPAFSMGRTQELLYELEQMHFEGKPLWQRLEIIIDSPLAAEFTRYYRRFRSLWDAEAKRKLKNGRHPLNFDTLYTVGDHQQHLATIDYLSKRNKPAVVIAASGMCSGGRIVNYLKAFIEDKRTDILFVGYQAKGTTGRAIQHYGPRNGYVMLEGKRYEIKAEVHTISGYSAHADQKDLIRFATKMRKPPSEIRIVHGDDDAKSELQHKLQQRLPNCDITVPKS